MQREKEQEHPHTFLSHHTHPTTKTEHTILIMEHYCHRSRPITKLKQQVHHFLPEMPKIKASSVAPESTRNSSHDNYVGDNANILSDSLLNVGPNHNQGEPSDNDSGSPNIPNYDENVASSCREDEQEESVFLLRRGTITSARFNILSTMVGGGSLSLPLAFHQAGKMFLGPLLLIFIAYMVKQSIYLLIDAAVLSHPADGKPDKRHLKGTKSFESVAFEAFGPKAKQFSMGLIWTICFFTIIGYAVLLRDMLLPFSDALFGVPETAGGSAPTDGPSLHHNLTMLAVILLVTPLCTMKNLTSLDKVGALSMLSIFSVACCVAYRSFQCNFSPAFEDRRLMHWSDYINYFPDTKQGFLLAIHELLNAIPILLSVFMCHFNVLPVHNELSNPTPARVEKLFSTSVWGAGLFYLFVGISGSMYGNCTPDGVVKGNVLLSFDKDDVLLVIGRLCLSLTITLAFPVLVVPCRDVTLRAFASQHDQVDCNQSEVADGSNDSDEPGVVLDELAEPLLGDDALIDENGGALSSQKIFNVEKDAQRIIVSIGIFWCGAAVACIVQSIDVVWEVLGSSLSLMMGFIIPSSCFLVILRRALTTTEDSSRDEEARMVGDEFQSLPTSLQDYLTKTGKQMASFLVIFFIGMMLLLSGNNLLNLI